MLVRVASNNNVERFVYRDSFECRKLEVVVGGLLMQ